MNDQLRAELLKQRSTPTILGLLVGMLGLILFAVLLHGLGLPARELEDRDNQLTVLGRGEFLAVLFAALLGAVSITAEFRHGTIRPTLVAMPRRGRILAAKLSASMLAGATLGVIGCAVAAAVGAAALHARGIEIQLTVGDYALLVAGGGAAAALWAAIGVGIGAVVRNQVPALVGICAWLLFVEGLLVGDVASVTKVGRFGPGAAAEALSGQHAGTLLDPAISLALLAFYATATSVASVIAMTKRDVW